MILRRCRSEWALLALVVASSVGPGSDLRAGTLQERPDGLTVGPFVFRPSLVAGLRSESNPFFRPSTERPASDSISQITPGVEVFVPFRNSALRLDYQEEFVRYDTLDTQEDSTRTLTASAELVFSSRDALTVTAERVSGLVRALLFDEGGEFVFDGESFALNRFELDLRRAVYGRTGYRLVLERSDLNFDEGADAAFFDYRGFDTSAEVWHPVSPSTWVTWGPAWRSYDQFLTTDPTGELFRTEAAGSLGVGIRGRLGQRNPYVVRVAYERAELDRADDPADSEFRGLTGSGSLELSVGIDGSLRLNAFRRALASFFQDNNYYVSDALGAQFDYRLFRNQEVGVSVQVGRNTYEVPLRQPGFPEDGVVREDERWVAEVYANFLIHRLFGIRVAARKDVRTSNLERFDYDNERLFVGIVAGWWE